MTESRDDTKRLALVLLAVGVVISLTVVPGVFIVDENNYLVNVLALRQGHVTVTNTRGLLPFMRCDSPWGNAEWGRFPAPAR